MKLSLSQDNLSNSFLPRWVCSLAILEREMSEMKSLTFIQFYKLLFWFLFSWEHCFWRFFFDVVLSLDKINTTEVRPVDIPWSEGSLGPENTYNSLGTLPSFGDTPLGSPTEATGFLSVLVRAVAVLVDLCPSLLSLSLAQACAFLLGLFLSLNKWTGELNVSSWIVRAFET